MLTPNASHPAFAAPARRKWALTQEAFDKLLAALGPDREEELEPRVECLERCLGMLSWENRELLLQYYQGEKGAKIENRKRLTDRFKVPLNTLRMLALRLIEKLRICVENCLKK
jgi:hypothetical protein